jgi:hypothetical protein
VHEDCPSVDVYVPAEHTEQLFCVPSDTAKKPAGHEMHAELFCELVGVKEYFPAGQFSQVVTPVTAENFPAGHEVHVPVTVDARYVETGHVLHDETPSMIA